MKLILVLFALCLTLAAGADRWNETPRQRDARMKWWREARFGMFVHFGLYAIPAGKWGSQTGHGEWIRETAHIPVAEYEKLKAQFNPTKFDADAWVRTAHDAGMKYIVVTTKHHDGFGLFDSAQTDWCVRTSPYGKDLMRQIADACRKYGMRIGWYHSIMDWHHPDYLPRRTWEAADRPAAGADMGRFVTYLKSQLKEILTNYGKIDLLWFDGEWESTWSDAYARDVYEFCRQVSPATIINNRVSNSRAGEMESSGASDQMGDYGTPEQFIPATGLAFDWETCMTMNDHWGFNAYDRAWKSSTELIRNLVDIASKGGNYLLNVGPRADGSFPGESVERLAEMGKWMKANGEAIYGTTASPFESLPFGRCTVKSSGTKTILYFHIFDWPSTPKLVIPGLSTKPKRVRLLGGTAPLVAQKSGSDVVIPLTKFTGDPHCTTIACEFDSPPMIYRTPKIIAETDLVLDAITAKIDAGKPTPELRYTLDGTDPTASSALVTKSEVRITGACTLSVASFDAGNRVSAVSKLVFHQAKPSPAVNGDFQPGLQVREYGARLEKMPDFASLLPRSEFTLPSPTLAYSGNPDEYVARVYEGVIRVDATAVYRVELTCDDGGKLWLDGRVAVDHDGLHGASAKSATVALAKGWHPIRVEWFNASGAAALVVRLAPVGKPLAELPPTAYAH